MSDIPFDIGNYTGYDSGDMIMTYDEFMGTEWESYFAAQNIDEPVIDPEFRFPITPPPELVIDRDQYLNEDDSGSQALMAAIGTMAWESACLPLTPQERPPSLVTSVTSSQSSIAQIPRFQCMTPDFAFSASNPSTLVIDATKEGMEAWADSDMSALGLGLGQEVTVPTFGWAALAPNPQHAASGPATSQAPQHTRHHLCPSAEMYHGGFELAGPSYILPPSPDPLDIRRRAMSVAVCVEGNIGHDLTPATPGPIPFTISLPAQDLPDPSLVGRSNSARQSRPKPNRGFPYVRSQHIRVIADQDKEYCVKTSPWDQEEIRVLNEVSDDYDLHFRANRGHHAEMDRNYKWASISDHVRMALHTPRSNHQILIQAGKLGLKPSTTTPLRMSKQARNRDKGF